MKKRWLLVLLPLAGMMCCGIGLGSQAAQPLLGYRGQYGYGQGSGVGEAPGGGDCAQAGVAYAENPFRGWPVDYRPGDWSLATFYFCARYADGSPHWGIDLGVPDGTPIVATCERGVVRQADDCRGDAPCWNYGMGRFVQVEAQVRVLDYERCVAEHGGDPQADACWADSGWRATYMHLAEVHVAVGQVVQRGDALGETDNTGNSTGPHLHYQINSPSGAVDPAPTMGG